MTQIVDGFGPVGNIFSGMQEGRATRQASEKRPTYSSKTFSKSEAFTTPTILPPF